MLVRNGGAIRQLHGWVINPDMQSKKVRKEHKHQNQHHIQKETPTNKHTQGGTTTLQGRYKIPQWRQVVGL